MKLRRFEYLTNPVLRRLSSKLFIGLFSKREKRNFTKVLSLASSCGNQTQRQRGYQGSCSDGAFRQVQVTHPGLGIIIYILFFHKEISMSKKRTKYPVCIQMGKSERMPELRTIAIAYMSDDDFPSKKFVAS